MTERPPIISRPERQSTAQKWGYRSVTALAWLFWFYLVIPLLSLVAWVVGLVFLHDVLLQGLTLDALLRLLATYGLGIAVLTGTYLLWALYSYLRFRRQVRRCEVRTVSDQALAALHGLPLGEVLAWRVRRQTTVDAETLKAMFEGGHRNGEDRFTRS